jgi:hypothetical protein
VTRSDLCEEEHHGLQETPNEWLTGHPCEEHVEEEVTVSWTATGTWIESGSGRLVNDHEGVGSDHELQAFWRDEEAENVKSGVTEVLVSPSDGNVGEMVVQGNEVHEVEANESRFDVHHEETMEIQSDEQNLEEAVTSSPLDGGEASRSRFDPVHVLVVNGTATER